MLSVKDTVVSVPGQWGSPLDVKRNATTVQPGAILASTDELIGTIEKDPTDELKFTVKPTGKVGVCTFTITADADLGDGVTSITGSFNMEVTPSQAVGFGEPSFGAPVEG